MKLHLKRAELKSSFPFTTLNVSNVRFNYTIFLEAGRGEKGLISIVLRSHSKINKN